MNTFATNLKNRRLELGMSQDELAQKLGYKTRSSINKIEKGINDVPRKKVDEFADALQTTPAALLGWDESKAQSAQTINHDFCLETLAKRLRQNEYDVEVFANSKEVANYLIRRCKNKTVGLSDSITITQMKLYEKLSEIYGENVIASEERISISKESLNKAITSDVFILSISAIAYDTGEMVNIGNVGYSIAGSLCDSGEIIIIANKNKITPNLEGAIYRARNVSATTATKNYGYRTPCTKTGKCENCDSSDRYCRLMCIYYRKPKLSHVTVVLLDQNTNY